MNQQRKMGCGTEGGGVHAMNDDEKIDEEQEEEHQKVRAMSSPDLPSTREVERVTTGPTSHSGAGVTTA